MLARILFSLAGATLIAGIATPAAAETWKCSAAGLADASYDGGSTAYIHLQGYGRGGTYSVKRKGKVATGTTKNGTRFTCRKVR